MLILLRRPVSRTTSEPEGVMMVQKACATSRKYECLRHSTHPMELGATMHEGRDTVLASHTRNHNIVTNVQARIPIVSYAASA
jgi:hypothetical protein